MGLGDTCGTDQWITKIRDLIYKICETHYERNTLALVCFLAARDDFTRTFEAGL